MISYREFERLLGDWVPGVTKAWIECPHGVKVLTGLYASGAPMAPTGEHPECLAGFQEAEADIAAYRLDFVTNPEVTDE